MSKKLRTKKFIDNDAIKKKEDEIPIEQIEKKAEKSFTKTDKKKTAIVKKVEKKVQEDDDIELDTSLILSDLNLTQIDKSYVMSEISKKQERDDKDEMKYITTSLEKLGISNYKKEPVYTIIYGDTYQISLFVNNADKSYELNSKIKIRCSWCTLLPPEGVNMLAVPFKYVPSYTEEHVYSPECINVVNNIQVEPYKDTSSSKKEQKAQKSLPRMNYFKRNITYNERRKLQDGSYVLREYFETSHPVCSFNCMKSKGRDLYNKDYKYKDVNMYINWMYRLIFGKYPEDIKLAPPHDILQEYGGDFTPEEYRNNFNFITVNDSNQYFIRYKTMTNPIERLYYKD